MSTITNVSKRIYEQDKTHKEQQFKQKTKLPYNKEKPPTDKIIFTFPSMQYVSPKIIKAIIYSIFKQQFYIMYFS